MVRSIRLKMAGFPRRVRHELNKARFILVLGAERIYAWLRSAARPVLPEPVRNWLARVLFTRSRSFEIEIAQILQGPQRNMSAMDYAATTRDIMWFSTPMELGAHTRLLVQAVQQAPRQLSDKEITESDYGRNALRCIELFGGYFWATTAAEIPDIARSFIARFQGEWQAPRAGQSTLRDPILVAPIYGSSCYQVIDGHHRIAIAAAQGKSHVLAKQRRLSVGTPLQELLSKMSWLEGRQELYQPIDAPEINSTWVTVRSCTDRLEKMNTLLSEKCLQPPSASSYLDIASCYGWFVSQMLKLGYDAYGIELDPLAITLGKAVYGLDPERIAVGDCVVQLRALTQKYDVVSCFSLLHHFAMGNGPIDAISLLRLLDDATGSVLFFETGHAHEEGLRDLLPEWDTPYIKRFLQEHATFDEIIDLGPDKDAVPPFDTNYGRHLFACLRHPR
jgi:hypothetical protein